MSSMQFGDGTMFNTADPSQAPAQPAAPLQPLEPLQPLQPPVAPAAPLVPVAPVEPVAAPAPAVAPAPAEPPAAMAVTDMRDVPLGTLVFRAGLLPEERLEEALQEGMKTGKRLGEILLERGWVSETDLGRLLAGQKGLPFVELDPSAIDPTAPPLLHPEKARLHGALPVGFDGGVPVVAVADPSNDLVIENVRRALACEPKLVVAGRDALLRAINECYGSAAVEAQPVAPQTQPVAEPAPVVEPVAPVVEPAVESAAAVVEPVAPVVEPVAPVVPVVPVVAAEPVEPVGPQVPVVPEPVEQPSEGAGVWLGPQPEPTPEPVAQVAAPEPTTVVPVAPEPQPVVEPEPVQAAAPAVPEPVTAPEAPVSWAVFVRLADGERLEVGGFTGQDEAFEGARAVISQIGSDGSWPFFAGRFIRPESIVSVDLVELEVTRWLGSQARAAALGPDRLS